MNKISTIDNRGNSRLLRKACGACCRKIRAQIAGVKEAIFAEYSRAFRAPERLVRLALNEAEAANELSAPFFPQPRDREGPGGGRLECPSAIRAGEQSGHHPGGVTGYPRFPNIEATGKRIE
jgi:hypothetical protein